MNGRQFLALALEMGGDRLAEQVCTRGMIPRSAMQNISNAGAGRCRVLDQAVAFSAA